METYLNIRFLNLLFILTSKYFYREASVSLFLFTIPLYWYASIWGSSHCLSFWKKKINYTYLVLKPNIIIHSSSCVLGFVHSVAGLCDLKCLFQHKGCNDFWKCSIFSEIFKLQHNDRMGDGIVDTGLYSYNSLYPSQELRKSQTWSCHVAWFGIRDRFPAWNSAYF